MTSGFDNIGNFSLGSDWTSGLNTDQLSFLDTLRSTDTSGLADTAGGGFSLGSLPWSKILGTVGKLGSGLLSGLAANETQKQPDYFLDTQWLGNGLAKSNIRSNRQEKQNQLDQMFGAGNMLSQLFPAGFGIFGNSSLNTNLGNTNTYDETPFLNWLNEKKQQYGVQQ